MLFFGADNFLRESIPVNLFLNRILLYQVVNYQKNSTCISVQKQNYRFSKKFNITKY
jgi:hypothetical protein